MILQNAHHVVRTQGLGDVSTFLWCEHSPAVIFINTLLLVEVTGICAGIRMNQACHLRAETHLV